MKKIILFFANLLSSFVLLVSISSVNSPSYLVFHQPKVPEALEKYRK
jgi:cyclic lactone autoinducer peptide